MRPEEPFSFVPATKKKKKKKKKKNCGKRRRGDDGSEAGDDYLSAAQGYHRSSIILSEPEMKLLYFNDFRLGVLSGDASSTSPRRSRKFRTAAQAT